MLSTARSRLLRRSSGFAEQLKPFFNAAVKCRSQVGRLLKGAPLCLQEPCQGQAKTFMDCMTANNGAEPDLTTEMHLKTSKIHSCLCTLDRICPLFLRLIRLCIRCPPLETPDLLTSLLFDRRHGPVPLLLRHAAGTNGV